MTPDEPRREDLAAYSLGALEPGPAADLERHLAECEACREYLAWLAPAVDVLPSSVEQLRPPQSVRRAVMAEVRADVAREVRQERSLRTKGWFRGFVLRPATAFAAAAALVVAAVGGYLLHGSGNPTKSIVPAEPTAAVKPGTVQASLERSGDSAALVVERMPNLPQSDVYEVWVQRGSKMSPEGTFVPRRDGPTSVGVPDSLDGADAVLVTREPRGGSDAPTSPPLLRAPLG